MKALTRAACAVAMVAGGVVVAAPTADAGGVATIVVTTTDDVTSLIDGETSLREAFAEASSDDSESEIQLGSGLDYVLDDCDEGGGDLDHTEHQHLTITGNGSTITQTCDDRVIDQQTNRETANLLVVTDLTVTGGDGGNGGGIEGDRVHVLRSRITGNSGRNGGGVFAQDTVEIIESTIDTNSSSSDGGGVYANEGGLVMNSTFVGNTSENRGGGFATDEWPATVLYSTLVRNEAEIGANIDLNGDDETLHLLGTVVAEPLGEGSNCAAYTAGTISHSFADDDSCSVDGAPGSQEITAHGLGDLADNGGPTPTMLPGAGSILLDAIATIQCSFAEFNTPTDQRGVTRPQAEGCDVGAVEVEPAPTPTTAPPTTEAAVSGTGETPAATPTRAQPTFTG